MGSLHGQVRFAQLGFDIDGEAAGDQSGYSVATSLDGFTIAIGASQNDGNGSNAGHVRIYDWSGGAWVQRGTDLDGEAAGDLFGYSVCVAADGNILASAAPNNSSNTGQVQLFI